MELHNGVETMAAPSRREWRNWLKKFHNSKESVWLIIYHKDVDTKSVYYEEAVEEAICFGWIDSIAHKRDGHSKYQFFARRKPKSNWSNANRERAEKMIDDDLMTPAGQAMIDHAKKSGTWYALKDVQQSVLPDDLKRSLSKNKTAEKNFNVFPPSSKRIILEWILNAKKAETRAKRITETVSLAVKNIRANHYRQ